MAKGADGRKKMDVEAENEQLRREIAELRGELENKEIIIDALLSRMKVRHDAPAAAAVKRARLGPRRPGAEQGGTAQSLPMGDKPDERPEEDAAALPAGESGDAESGQIELLAPAQGDSPPTDALVAEIRAVFRPKKKSVEFKMNFTLRQFVEYAEAVYEFKLSNRKVFSLKNPLRMYVGSHIGRIVKFIIENINSLNLNQICSTLFMINSAMDYKYKLVVAHDVLISIRSMSRIVFIFSSLFNNMPLTDDVISQIIRKILYHQHCIDTNILADEDVREYLCVAGSNFELSDSPVTLWMSLSHFLTVVPLFTADRRVDESAIESGFALRMLCHYIDWNYTYNEFLVNQLIPVMTERREPVHMYYAGILAMNALRTFGAEEGSTAVFEELARNMDGPDDASMTCYLILKQTRPGECLGWYERHKEALEGLGYEDGKSLLLY